MKMNANRFAASIVAILLILGVSASAQKRKTSKASTGSPAASSQNIADIQAGATKVTAQIKYLTNYVFVLGGIVNGIEAADSLAKDVKVSKATLDQTEQAKQKLLQSINGLGSPLAALVVEFRTKPGLMPYASKIEGVSAMAGNAEDLAAAGRFRDAGKELVALIGVLTETLGALP